MPLIAYQAKDFQGKTLQVIRKANEICRDYASQGYDLTLRQLYYQFVSMDLIPNEDTEYKKLGAIINDARLCGMLDWDFIQDRTRSLKSFGGVETGPEDEMRGLWEGYYRNPWLTQDHYIEVWVEKDALAGVIQRACQRRLVPFFSCRGYTSSSEMWAAGQRLLGKIEDGKTPHIIHLGDHDPSGIDMTRDITDRLAMFAEEYVDVTRVALNMDQVEQYDPPPNPAKISDSRSDKYIEEFGHDSWELDALSPQVMNEIIQGAIEPWIDEDAWAEVRIQEEREKEMLGFFAERYVDLEYNQVEIVDLIDANPA